jgi:hypothetical protein
VPVVEKDVKNKGKKKQKSIMVNTLRITLL